MKPPLRHLSVKPRVRRGRFSPFAKFVLSLFVVKAVHYGGAKTNGVNNIPPRMRTAAAVSFAERKQANWNVRGAWKDSFWLDFDGGWVFPHGTNHLAGVEVVSFGQVWATPSDTNAVASAGAAFEIVPGLTTFAQEHTPSNTYRFAWTDAALGRDTNALVSAALELFRNGDVAVTTNGVTTTRPRALPFPHNGFGQDAEWVAANFTNATEILAVGYANWVDAQVGVGLTNGLYKLTIAVLDDPPEVSQLVVGDCSVAVTNAGEYVFLLEKGLDYPLAVFPSDFTNAVYSAVDDVPQTRGAPGGLRGGETRTWTTDSDHGIEPPMYGFDGRVWWMPLFFGSPDIPHIGPAQNPATFAAAFADCRAEPSATYQWTASDGLTLHSPNAKTTQVSVGSMPSWAQADMSVTATVGDHALVSYLDVTYGTNDVPQAHLSIGISEGLVLGGERGLLTASFRSDAETNGCMMVRCVNGSDKISLWSEATNGVPVASSNSWDVTSSHAFSCYVQGASLSDYEGVEFECSYIPEHGGTEVVRAKSTVFECLAQPVSNVHRSGLEVVNPSFLSAQSNAAFRVEVSPSTIPASKIRWRAVSGSASFPFGSSGAEAVVQGTSGMVDLEVNVLGATDERMHFKAKVVQ